MAGQEKTDDGKTVSFKIPKLPEKFWIASTIFLLIASALLLFRQPGIGTTGATGAAVLTPDQAAGKAVEWIKSYYSSSGASVTVALKSAENTANGLTKFVITVSDSSGSNDETLYVTGDGKLFIPQIIETENKPSVTTTQPVAKVDVPVAKAFVMSYCPYGLQFLKAYVPVMELLGGKASLSVNFVNYAMHGEKEVYENLRQYCIQKEQGDKLTPYLRCFVEATNYTDCLLKANIDTAKLDVCMDATDEQYGVTRDLNDESTWNSQYPPFNVEADENMQYSVSGSPTFILNGQEVSVGRTAEAIKEAICSSFNTPPAECNQILNSNAEQAGAGPIGASGGSTGSASSCG